MGILALLAVCYVGLVVYINWPAGPIAKDLRITNEWTDIKVDPPLKATHRSQSLQLRIRDFDMDTNPKISDIKLPDGTAIDPEVEIYDEVGHSITLHNSGYARKYFDAVVFSPSEDLSVEREYLKIRIRSEVSFNCEAIYWSDYNPK